MSPCITLICVQGAVANAHIPSSWLDWSSCVHTCAKQHILLCLRLTGLAYTLQVTTSDCMRHSCVFVSNFLCPIECVSSCCCFCLCSAGLSFFAVFIIVAVLMRRQVRQAKLFIHTQEAHMSICKTLFSDFNHHEIIHLFFCALFS
jgi:hypothetical protein